MIIVVMFWITKSMSFFLFSRSYLFVSSTTKYVQIYLNTVAVCYLLVHWLITRGISTLRSRQLKLTNTRIRKGSSLSYTSTRQTVPNFCELGEFRETGEPYKNNTPSHQVQSTRWFSLKSTYLNTCGKSTKKSPGRIAKQMLSQLSYVPVTNNEL